MKSCGKCEGCRIARSHPARGAWIEIPRSAICFPTPTPSHPSRGAWIEIGFLEDDKNDA